MSGRADPLTMIVQSVRVIGEDYCWPATEILDVLKAFEELDRVVLSAELWRFDEGLEPTGIGWTDYEVRDGPWRERVAHGSRRAADELLEHTGDSTAWVSLTWEHCEDSDA